MRIGIDISQLAYEKTGVAGFLSNLVQHLLMNDTQNEYVLFFSSMRKKVPVFQWGSDKNKITIKTFKLPPTALDILWNRLHIMPIETFIGDVDVFISSDWVQPPSKAKKVTILYDLIVYTHPEETARTIVATQRRRLKWVKKECDKILCISESTKRDAETMLHINKERLEVIYPGI